MMRPVTKIEGTTVNAWKPHVHLKADTSTPLTKAQRKKKRAAEAPPPVIPNDGGTVVYVDGSALANGKPDARAGIGIYFGVNDARNLSQRLPTALYKQTNQCAELCAAITGIDLSPRDKPLTVITDSDYVVKFVNEWRFRPDWRTKDGHWIKNSVNMNLQRKLSDAIDKRKPQRTTFIHVYGHAKTEGNIRADVLAEKGALMEDV